jgi:hypothetical protein
MKDSVKITVIAAGFKDANKKNIHQKESFLPKTWKAGREIMDEPPVQQTLPNVVHQQRGSGFVLTNPESNNVRDVSPNVPADDLDVPTFLRRQAQKA